MSDKSPKIYNILTVILVIGFLTAIYLVILVPWMNHWGVSDAEAAMPLPGDGAEAGTLVVSTRGVTVQAPASEVWKWVVQLGQERAGFYSNDWLENLTLADIHNADVIRPEWQSHQLGDAVLGAGGVIYGQGSTWQIKHYEAGRATYLWGAIVILPEDEQTSRLLVRTYRAPATLPLQIVNLFSFDWMHFVMERGMLLGIKARAEGRLNANPILRWLAALGWIAAAAGIALVLFARHRGWWWGLIPLTYALAIVVFTRHLGSAITGFLWLGVITAGFVLYGRRWWKGLALTAAFVVLIFVVAPQPYIAFGIVFLAIVGLVGVIWFLSYPGKPYPILGEDGKPLPGSLSEKAFVKVNGIRQGMFIQSKNPNTPVLLFLHGGPGFPEYWLTRRYPTGLENDFTVVWWDQRGSGLSYSTDIPPETMTYEQLILDTVEVTNILRRRFGKEKIYLMAHSGGSFFGIQVAARFPELYHAYIGMGQMVYQLESEQLAYQFALEQCRATGNTRLLKKLEAAPPSMSMPLPPAYDALRDEYMHKLGIGTTRGMDSVVTGVFFPSWFSKELTLGEKIALWRGKIYSMKMLRNTAFVTDLTKVVTELQIPVYFFSGASDYTCNYGLSRAYLEQLRAPLKGFYLFDHSAHTPLFEEPEKVLRFLREDVLAGTNQSASGRSAPDIAA